MTEPWTFGVEPLAQTEEVAGRLRRLASLVVAMETEDDAVGQLVEDLGRAIEVIERRVPSDPAPRVGAGADGGGRAYVDHARDIGAYNPAFPEYQLTVAGDRAEGTVTFPIAYEGPPGLVHGGFLALLLDCVVQHHSCDVGLAGKTTGLSIRYRRPTPLLTPLSITIDRRVEEDRIRSTARLLDGDQVLCEAEVEAIAGNRAALPPVSPRRSP